MKIFLLFALGFGAFSLSGPALASADDNQDCGEMEILDISMGMCMPRTMDNMSMSMLMVHGNGFFTQVVEQGPRGRSAVAFPDMFMADVGTTLGNRHYLNLDLMTTVEKWTFPDRGYPELLQIGESDSNGSPFLDAQHPHNSPIMGLTVSDTVSIGEEKDHLKLFFAPRGESTDGPIAFMHRITGMVNPDVPLGHHIGQDVGHISSTVLGGALQLGDTQLQASVFNGTEPEPESVNLPLATPNSYALRLIEEFSPKWMGMISAAYIQNPEPDFPDIAFETRYSASIYNQVQLTPGWKFHNSLIYGLINNYDHANLFSVGEEFLFSGDCPRIWGRVEFVQRTPAELGISTVSAPDDGHVVTALTLGYTHAVFKSTDAELGIGASITSDLLPSDYKDAYGGSNPWSGRIFIQFSGMKMWEL